MLQNLDDWVRINNPYYNLIYNNFHTYEILILDKTVMVVTKISDWNLLKGCHENEDILEKDKCDNFLLHYNSNFFSDISVSRLKSKTFDLLSSNPGLNVALFQLNPAVSKWEIYNYMKGPKHMIFF